MSDWSLVCRPRFGPILGIQAIAGFSNNFFKTATVVAITFSFYPDDARRAGLLAAVAMAAGALPGFLFASVAGQVGERMDKARLARIIRALDVLLMIGVLLALTSRAAPALVAIFFFAGVRSTFYSPLKYSILPGLLERRQLLFATGLLQAAVIVAAFAGQVAGGLVDPFEAGLILLAASFSCFLLSLLIPPVPSECPGLAVDRNVLRGIRELVRGAFAHADLRAAIVGISAIDACGAILLSQFAPLVRHEMGGTPAVVSLFFGAFAIGAALGAMLVNRLLRGEISTRLAPWIVIVLGAAMLALWLTATRSAPGHAPTGLSEFLARPVAWVMVALATVIAAATAMVAVPLFGILQTAGHSSERNRYVAANNILNAAAVMLFLGLVGAALRLGLGPADILLAAGLAMASIGVALAARGRAGAPIAPQAAQ